MSVTYVSNTAHSVVLPRNTNQRRHIIVYHQLQTFEG